MHIHSNAKIKKLDECKAGELIYTRYADQQTWAVVLDTKPIEQRFILIGRFTYQDNSALGPSFLEIKKTLACLSYGTDWAIRPVLGDESFAGNQELVSTPGILHCDRDRWLICFQSASQHFFDEIHFDLTSGERDYYPSAEAVPFKEWQVWEREEDIGSNARPLFAFGNGQ